MASEFCVFEKPSLTLWNIALYFLLLILLLNFFLSKVISFSARSEIEIHIIFPAG